MPVDESVVRVLLARIKNIIEAECHDLGYAAVIFEAGDSVFYAPASYATNLDAEGIRGVGEFLIEAASGQSPPVQEDPEGPEEEGPEGEVDRTS
jgi:hypothetical protein